MGKRSRGLTPGHAEGSEIGGEAVEGGPEECGAGKGIVRRDADDGARDEKGGDGSEEDEEEDQDGGALAGDGGTRVLGDPGGEGGGVLPRLRLVAALLDLLGVRRGPPRRQHALLHSPSPAFPNSFFGHDAHGADSSLPYFAVLCGVKNIALTIQVLGFNGLDVSNRI